MPGVGGSALDLRLRLEADPHGTIPNRDVERVLVVVAHPDDAEFWAGGTIAGWTDTGIEVTYCVLTDDGGSGFGPRCPTR
jgi:LmbE family N-acetylglucosaminyl deacetylase